MKRSFRSITSVLGRQERASANNLKMVFGAVCTAVNADGTINVEMRSVNELGDKITAQMPNIRMVGNDIPNEQDLVVLQDQGAGKVVYIGRLRTDSVPGSGSGGTGVSIGSNRVLAHWKWSDGVTPSYSTRTGVDDSGTIAGFSLTVLTRPPELRVLALDILLNGVSLWANPSDRPTPVRADFDPDRGLYIFAFDSPIPIRKDDVIQGQIMDGAGARWLEMKVLAGS